MKPFENEEFEGAVGFNVRIGRPTNSIEREGFNEFGVRENYDGEELESIDVIFEAMEPGIRKGIEITPEFLQGVVDRIDGELPLQYDHSHSQRANVGKVIENKFDEKMKLMVNIPNTGSSLRTDTISDFTHSTGPQITDGSIGLDPRSLEFEESEHEDAMAKFTYAEMIEFSLTPFPGGYDNGGVAATFSEQIEKFVDESESTEAESQLEVYESQIL